MKQILFLNVFLIVGFSVMADQYRVELSVFETSVDQSYFKGIEGVKLMIDRNDLYRYYVGDFENMMVAEGIKKEAIDKGFKYAKIINYSEIRMACSESCTPDKIHPIFFDFDRDVLRQRSKIDLDYLSYYLKANTNHSVRLEGHTDSKGSDTYNEDLSLRRVATAKQYLLDNGVEQNRVMVQYYGENQPIAKNNYLGQDSPEGRQYNRRVMFVILDEQNHELEGIVAPILVPELLKYPLFKENALLTLAM